MSVRRIAWILAATLVLVIAGSLTAQTVTETKTVVAATNPSLHRGLYQIQGSSNYFWVDDFGIRHYVKEPDVVRTKYFTSEPVVTVTKDEIHALPVGRSLTVATGPETFTTRDDSAIMLNSKPKILLEYGSGPTARRIEIHNMKNLKNVEDLEDLEDLEDIFDK